MMETSSGSLSKRPSQPSRRKSSNLLASLGRQNTLTDRERERERERDRETEEASVAGSSYAHVNGTVGRNAGHTSAYDTPRGPSMYVSSAAMAPGPSSNSTIFAGGSTTPTASGNAALRTDSAMAPTAQNTPSSQSSFGVALENLRYMLQKRISTFIYLKKAHEGRLHLFNTILLQRAELDHAFGNAKMAKRTLRYAVLGMSLSALLDIGAAHDFLRGLLSLLQEIDTATDEKFAAKTRNIFKTGNKKRPSGASDYPLSVQDSGDPSYLFSPNIPFDLDYFQILYTLCDILAEVYSKILSFVGPSTASANATPAFPGFPQPTADSSRPAFSQTAQSIYPSTVSASGISINASTSLDRRQGVGLSPMLLEVVMKIDTKLKKIITVVTKELEGVSRTAIKDELALIAEGFSRGGLSLDAMYQL